MRASAFAIAFTSLLALPFCSRAQSSTPVPFDFNGDGNPDIVWRNFTTGSTVVWFMDGGTGVLGTANLPTWPDGDLHWRIASLIDFDGDGKPDITWRNTQTGRNTVMLMDGTTLISTLELPAVTDLNWYLCGAADFDGDGQPDLVWRNVKTGENVIWLMNGGQIKSKVTLDTVNTEWQIVGVADLNGDGKPDLLWADYWKGDIVVWTMDGTSVTSKSTVGTWSDPNWRIDTTTVDGSGRPKILWRHYTKGWVQMYSFNNLKLADWVNLPTVPDTNWQIGGSFGVDPASLVSDREDTMLIQEQQTLDSGGYDDIEGLPAISSLYTINGERVFSYPPRSSTSRMYQYRKRQMDNYVNDNRLSRKAVESELGGYEGVDPATGLQAWFVNGAKEWIWGDFTWP